MKKKNMKIAALSLAVLVAGTGAFHAYGSYQQSGESDALLNENILALSSEGEDGEAPKQPETCYNTVTTDPGHVVLYCGGCIWVDGSKSVFSGSSMCNPAN